MQPRPIQRLSVFLALAAVLLGTGCASPNRPKSVTRLPALPVISPARVEEPVRIKENAGVASWYGEEHRGDLMANGQPFNPDALTAASWFFPLGTWVKVTHGVQSVVVEITDRGPARYLVEQGRIIDLSHAAFARLDDPKLGLIEVKVEPARRAGDGKVDAGRE